MQTAQHRARDGLTNHRRPAASFWLARYVACLSRWVCRPRVYRSTRLLVTVLERMCLIGEHSPYLPWMTFASICTTSSSTTVTLSSSADLKRSGEGKPTVTVSSGPESKKTSP